MDPFVFLVILIIILLLFVCQKQEKIQYGYSALTIKGEEVRSHAEQTIADFFLKNGINYEYEHNVRGIGRPDFYLPDYDIIVEYWGLVDAEDEGVKNRYVKKMRWKMAQYHSQNIKFISIYPWDLINLDVIFKRKFKQITGKRLH